jgi:hypothetical protein
MPIMGEARPIIYLCDGSQVDFPITFEYLENSFVWVRRYNSTTLDTTTLSLGPDYTIAADTVTTTSTYPSGDKITLSLLVPITQEKDFERNGQLDADVLDWVHDKLTLICQRLNLDAESLIGLEVPEATTPSMKLPGADTRASKYLAFDINGDVVVVTALDTGIISVSPWGETLVGLANSAAGRAQLDVYSTTETDAISNDLAGAGRTTETIKDNADGITDLAGAGRTTETVKSNADYIADLAGSGRTTETVKTNADNISDLMVLLEDTGTYGSWSVGIAGTVVPAGGYMITHGATIQIKNDSSTWVGTSDASTFGSGLIISDGVNIRLIRSSGSETIYYRKLW